jgi:flavin reductase (DIM6/NTAB) family NADH-FMN oxidoreductase RutF
MRAVLGHFCTGVAVITGHDGDRPVGFSCQSVASVSLDPPYVSVCPDKFAGVGWSPGRNGAPALHGVLATIEAELAFEHDAGDHTIAVARVTGLRADEERRPLLFYRGGFGGFHIPPAHV